MDLLELLEVNEDRLPNKTRSAVRLFRAFWGHYGRPTEPTVLAEFMDESLKACINLGYHYPKIFLLRLKQLQREEWRPHLEQKRAGLQEKDEGMTSMASTFKRYPDLMQRVAEKERNGELWDDEMRSLLQEKLMRERERRKSGVKQPPVSGVTGSLPR